jgi:hypothetical protein
VHYLRESNDSPFLEVVVAGVAPATVLRTEKMPTPTRTDKLAEKILDRYGVREATNTVSIHRLSRPVLRAQSFTIDKPSYGAAGYLCQEEGNQVAIVFHIDKARKDDSADKLMKTSLRSLAVGTTEVDNARRLYEYRHKHRASGTAPARP